MDVTQYIDLESYSYTPGFLGYTDTLLIFQKQELMHCAMTF